MREADGRQLAVYRAWIAAGTENPRPYNGVGAILERRQDWRGARDAYARSLELEWNQPPIIEAKSRVDQQGRRYAVAPSEVWGVRTAPL